MMGVPTLVVARTDADSASLLTSDADERDHEFLTGERSPEGFYYVRSGVEAAIARGLAYAPYADLVWMETSTPDLDVAREFADAIHADSPASCSRTTARPPSTGGGSRRRDDRAVPARARGDGLQVPVRRPRGLPCAQRVDVRARTRLCGGGHARRRAAAGAEFALEEAGYTATKHQREVGAGWFDEIARPSPAAEARRSPSRARPKRSSSTATESQRIEAWHSSSFA